MVRTATWSSDTLGTPATTNNYLDLLRSANLDYTAVRTPAYADFNGTQIAIPDKQAVVREDTGAYLGLVSDRYQLCQNRDALSFVQHIDDITLLKAGALGLNNSIIYMIGQLPEVTVLGDTITPHLIFQNSHDGSSSIKATICMLRVVCQNQFVSTFHDSPATIVIRHQGKLDDKLIAARETLQSLYNYVRSYDAFAQSQVTQRVDSKTFDKILETYFVVPEDATKRTESNIIDCRNAFIRAYEEDDNQNFKGTKLGLINAFSDYMTHKTPMKRSANWEKNRFLNTINPMYMDQFRKVVDSIAA